MQKTILGAAIAAICGLGTSAAMAQQASTSKVELWGIADAAIRHTNNEGANKGSLTKMIGGGMSQSRWGINVEEDLGGGTKALVHLEHRFNLDTGEKDATAPFFQLSYIGLQGPYGRLTMGRQWNVLFDVVSSTYASFPYSPYMDAYKPELGMAAGARTSNSLKYLLATPDRRWVGALQYSFHEGNQNTSAVENTLAAAAPGLINSQLPPGAPSVTGTTTLGQIANAIGPQNLAALMSGVKSTINNADPNSPLGQAVAPSLSPIATGSLKTFGGFLRYSQDGISVGGGYLRTHLPAGTKLDAWTLGGSYRKDKLYVNLGYGANKIKNRETFNQTANSTISDIAKFEARRLVDQTIINGFWQGQTNGGFLAGDSDKRTMYKLGFGYQITPQINAGIHYYHAKQKGSASGNYNGKADFVVALANYAFSKRTDAYFGVDHTKVRGGEDMYLDRTSKARSRTGITVGLRHRF